MKGIIYGNRLPRGTQVKKRLRTSGLQSNSDKMLLPVHRSLWRCVESDLKIEVLYEFCWEFLLAAFYGRCIWVCWPVHFMRHPSYVPSPVYYTRRLALLPKFLAMQYVLSVSCNSSFQGTDIFIQFVLQYLLAYSAHCRKLGDHVS
jgi:hypothetical protein